MDPLVKILKVSDQVGFDPVTLLPLRNKVVTFTVGEQGPFTIVTPASEFTEKYVEEETKKTADTLRAIGAVK